MIKLNSRSNSFLRRIWLMGLIAFFMALFPPTLSALLQVNRVLLVDDFERQTNTNLLGGMNRGDQKSPGGCAPGFVTGQDAFREEGRSLFLAYDVTEPDSISYFSMKLGKENPMEETSEPFDLSAMRYLSFWMKRGDPGKAPRLEFAIEIHEDSDGDQKFLLQNDTADRIPAARFTAGTPRGGWQKIVIPLEKFHKIHHWNQILEVAFVFENRWHPGKGRLYLDQFLFGSNYPGDFMGKEIPMQNRVSSFKISRQLPIPGMRLKPGKSSLTLTLTFIDPYLEEIRFEESRDGGESWIRIQSFYDHSNGGTYETDWETQPRGEVLLRALGVSLFGGETKLAGPYELRIN